MTSHLENLVEFIDNPESRVACVVMLDVSRSMTGTPIAEMNAGIQRFKDELEKDELTALRADVAVIAFNRKQKVVQNFGNIADFNPPALAASGGARIAPAVNSELDLIEERKAQYRAAGVSYYRPIAMLVTDGRPKHDEPDELAQTAARIKENEAGKHLTFFAVGTETADLGALSKLSNLQPKMLGGVQFRALFEWLSNSITAISQSQMGQEVALPATGGWERY